MMTQEQPSVMVVSCPTTIEYATQLLARLGTILEVNIRDNEFYFQSRLSCGQLTVRLLDTGIWMITLVQGISNFSDRGFNLAAALYRVMTQNPANILPIIPFLNPIEVYVGQLEYYKSIGKDWLDVSAFWNMLMVEQQNMLGLYLLQLRTESLTVSTGTNQ
jgi:hypothetical protein